MTIKKAIISIKQMQVGLFLFFIILQNPLYATGSEFGNDMFQNTNLTAHWSIFSKPPYQYDGSKMLWIEAKTTRTALEALVPEQLKINDENKIIFFIGRLRITSPDPITYNEGGISIPVSYKEKETEAIKKSVYIPILYLEDHYPIIGGREFYGANKHLSKIEFIENEKTIKASVAQWGITLMDMNVTLKTQVIDKETSQDNVGWITVKRIPSIKQDGSLDVHKLNHAHVRNHKIKELHIGEGQLNLGATEWDPLSKIPILEITNAGFHTESLILDNGSELHDYLKD